MPNLTYAGYGYTPRGTIVTILADEDAGLVLGVESARYESDEDGWPCIEWDAVGALDARYAGKNYPPPRDLVLGELSDDQQEDYYDELRDVLREVLRD